MRPLAILCLPLLLGNACVWWSTNESVLITSDPMGARIFVDGTDTGATTPTKIEIGGNFGYDHVIELRLAGHRSAKRVVYQYTEGYTSKWIDGAYSIVMPPLPLFWTAGDMIFPFGVRGALVPDLHVKLYREDEPLLGFELLASRNERPPDGTK